MASISGSGALSTPERPNKRSAELVVKTEGEDGKASKIRRHEKYYTPENRLVVLRCDSVDLKETVLLKVSRALLENSSPLFAKKISAKNLPIHEGCPVVRLDDKLEDLENFLSVLVESK
jgi:hypothetical protein